MTAMGSLLDLKPILTVTKEGKIVSFDKVKGRKKVIRYLADMAEKITIRSLFRARGHLPRGLPGAGGAFEGGDGKAHEVRRVLAHRYWPGHRRTCRPWGAGDAHDGQKSGRYKDNNKTARSIGLSFLFARKNVIIGKENCEENSMAHKALYPGSARGGLKI